MSEKTLMERLNENITLQNNLSNDHSDQNLTEHIFTHSQSGKISDELHKETKTTEKINKLAFLNLFDSSTTENMNSDDFSIDKTKKDETNSTLDSTIAANKDNINININNHDFKTMVNRTILNVLFYLYKNNIKYSVCGPKSYLNLLCSGNLYNIKKIKQKDEKFTRMMCPTEWNVLISKQNDIKNIISLAEKAFNIYLKNEYNKLTFNRIDNDMDSAIYLEEPKINLLTFSSLPSKLSSLKKTIIYLLLILNFAINNILNKGYYCRLISLYIHEKKIFFEILNDIKNIINGNKNISLFKLNNNDFYYDNNGIVYMGLYNSLFTLIQQLCNENNFEINLGLHDIISKLLDANKIDHDALFSIDIDKKIHIRENVNIFDSKLSEIIGNNLITKLDNMMKSKNKLKIIGYSNDSYLKINSSLFLGFEMESNNTILSKLKSMTQYAVNNLISSNSASETTSEAASETVSETASETASEIASETASESASETASDTTPHTETQEKK